MLDVLEPLYEEAPNVSVNGRQQSGPTEVFGSERLTGALLDRLTHHVHILEMNGESYRLKRSRGNAVPQAPDDPVDA